MFGQAKSADLERAEGGHRREFSRPSRVPGGRSEEMLGGWWRYQAWSEPI